MSAQTGVLPPAAPHARLLALRCNSEEGLKEALDQFESARKRLNFQYPEAQLVTTVGFGPTLWKSLAGKLPKGFKSLAPLKGLYTMPASEVDVFVHVQSQRTDICFAMVQELMVNLQGHVEVLDDITGFRYLDRRDLTGFIDGVENAQTMEDRADIALIEEGEHADGTFLFAQRYVHQLDKWRKLSVEKQEKVIGRTKYDSIELDESVMPEDSHVSRVVIEENGEELEILRHSIPYGQASGEQGLYFLACTKNLAIIDKMLASMFGTDGHPVGDRLLKFVTPVNGAYFFVPSAEMLEEVLG